jgi:cell division septum initiation protein DivIVA
MTAELHADDGATHFMSAHEPVLREVPGARTRPNVSGDLPTVLDTAPMFRRAVAGYDRFQVDTYVQWAEDELATADREREHLVARHLRTRAALQEARELLAHSAAGGEFLGLSRRIGSMLAAAADEVTSMRAAAEADRAAASAQVEQALAHAGRVLADAETEAERMVAAAAAEVEEMLAAAGRIVDEAEQTGVEARAEAQARLEKVRLIEERATEHAEQIRRQAQEDASAARLQARDEAVRLLTTGREQRRRADAEAAAARDLQDRDAARRAASLRAEVAVLELRRNALRTEVELLTGPVGRPTGSPAGRLRRADRELAGRRPRAAGSRALHQLFHDVRRVMSHTVQEGRVAAMLIFRADDEEARLQRPPAVLGDGARCVADGHVQPGVVRSVPGRPDDGPDPLAVQS